MRKRFWFCSSDQLASFWLTKFRFISCCLRYLYHFRMSDWFLLRNLSLILGSFKIPVKTHPTKIVSKSQTKTSFFVSRGWTGFVEYLYRIHQYALFRSFFLSYQLTRTVPSEHGNVWPDLLNSSSTVVSLSTQHGLLKPLDASGRSRWFMGLESDCQGTSQSTVRCSSGDASCLIFQNVVQNKEFTVEFRNNLLEVIWVSFIVQGCYVRMWASEDNSDHNIYDLGLL